MNSAKVYVIRYYDRSRCGWFDWMTSFDRRSALSELRRIRAAGIDFPVCLTTREL